MNMEEKPPPSPRRTDMDHQTEIETAIAQFPEVFGLRGFPDSIFSISDTSSFIDRSGDPILYTQILDLQNGEWNDFAKCTARELRKEIAHVPFVQLPHR